MSNKAYRTIVVLLSLALVSFFAVQYMWFNNSFVATQMGIFRSTIDALTETTKLLEQRSELAQLKNDFVFEKESPLPHRKGKMKIVMSSSGYCDTSVETLISNANAQLKHLPKIPKVPNVPNTQDVNMPGISRNVIMVSDSLIKLTGDNGKMIVINQQVKANASAISSKSEDLGILVEKMMMEVRAADVSPLEKMNPKSLQKILTDALKRHGIEAPFEFAVVRDTNKNSVIFCSAGFDKGRIKTKKNIEFFEIKENILKKNDTLCFYLASDDSLVYSRMKKILWISALFAFFILGTFIATLRLIRKQKKLAEVKNDFINNMTHELKTPIATISIAADALKNPKVKADSEKSDYYSSVIKEENNKMNRNVEKVLQLALTDKNEFRPEFSEVNLNRLIEKCISNFEVLFAAKNIKCEFFPGGETLIVRADAFHLENAVNNLIDNASKYASANPRITIRTKTSDGKILLSVEDNGIGMSDELQKRIFEKFYRAQMGNIHDVKGFGIGLSYAYNIVKAHNGAISVSSELGKGSIFTIELPAV